MKQFLETIENIWVAVTFAEHGLLPLNAMNDSFIQAACSPLRRSEAATR